MMDFGAARQVDNDMKSKSIVLKPGYTPEEQYRSKGMQGSWTDVYALCATIYRCITGVVPDDALQRCYKDELKAPSELGIKIGKEQEKCLMKGLAVKADKRCQKISELYRLIEEEEKAKPEKKSAETQSGNIKRVLALLTVLTLLCVAVIGSIVSGIVGRTKSEPISYPTERMMTSDAAVVLKKANINEGILGLTVLEAEENEKFKIYKVICEVDASDAVYMVELIYELNHDEWILGDQSKIQK